MPVKAVGQFGVNLVRQHQHVRLAQDGGDLLHLVGAHDRAGGVIRVREDQQLCPRRDGRPQLVGSQAELILGAGGNMHRHAAGQLGDRLIADKAGLGNDNLVPGLDHRADDQVDGLTAADRDKDIFLFIVQVKAAAKVAADLIAQLLQAGVGCVFGAAQLKAADACIADAPRRFKVRLADAQRDAVRHFSRQIKEPADAGRAHRLGGRGKQFIVVHHRTVHSLSSGSSARYRRPPRL